MNKVEQPHHIFFNFGRILYMIYCFGSFVRSHEPGAGRLYNPTNAEHFFGICLQVFRQAEPPQPVAKPGGGGGGGSSPPLACF